jgi:hypothetical protein
MHVAGKEKEINLHPFRKNRDPAVSSPPLLQATVEPLPAIMANFPINPLEFLPEGLIRLKRIYNF